MPSSNKEAGVQDDGELLAVSPNEEQELKHKEEIFESDDLDKYRE